MRRFTSARVHGYTRRLLWMAGALLVLTPAPALACPVCGLAGPGDNGWAYALMSVILSALPLGMIGGIVFWLYRKSKASDAVAARQEKALRPTTDR